MKIIVVNKYIFLEIGEFVFKFFFIDESIVFDIVDWNFYVIRELFLFFDINIFIVIFID